MKIIMTLLARDEIDIIGANLEWHRRSGVDFFVVVDNGSIDGTRELLDEYQRAGVVTVRDEPGLDHEQGAWITRAAIEARDIYGADWIINNDADEFWMCADGSYRDILKDVDSAVGVLKCPRQNMFCSVEALPQASETGEYNYLCYRVNDPPTMPLLKDFYSDSLEVPYFYYDLPPKVIVRGAGLEEIHQGNHGARHHGAELSFGNQIRIRHFPVRSRVQFEKKITQGGKAYTINTRLPVRTAWHWRRWYRMYMEQGIDVPLKDAIPTQHDLNRHSATGLVIYEPGSTATQAQR